MSKIRKEIEYGIYFLVYGSSFILSSMGHHYISGMLLMLLAVWLYGITVYETHNPVDLKALLALSWIGGQGLACLQLSYLQKDWQVETWVCFLLVYLCFCIGYNKKWKKESLECEMIQSDIIAHKIFHCAAILAVVSVVCFSVEAIIIGYIPLFSKLPHAYSYFHISGVHYFTISCILIPALTVIYAKLSVEQSRWRVLVLGICNCIAVAIPVLCVSRFQLLFAVAFALVIYLLIFKKISIKTILILVCLMVPVYIALTIARNHNISYLNGIFEMKYGKMPIFITQPYMYVANNYENFNCMVEQLVKHTYGLKMLFPVFALSGMKFLFPQLVAFVPFITKPELTTLTMFYDAYYDFGMIGIIGFSIVLGLAACKIKTAVQTCGNPIVYLYYGQIAIYLALSFFTTWFSNPTTWFWLALTTMMYVYVGYSKKEET
ncbi:MAG: O-antigen polymerase [Lachnospiraceae bacterium]